MFVQHCVKRFRSTLERRKTAMHAGVHAYNRFRNTMSRTQLNLRISEELGQAIDEKRIALREQLGLIPSRSDVLRLALEAFLERDLTTSEGDRRRTTGPAKRRRS